MVELPRLSGTEIALGASAIGVGLGVGALAIAGGASKRKTRKSSGRKRDRLFKSKQKHERKYKRKRKYKVYGRKGFINPRKKKSKSRRGLHYTCKGQPYILLKNGKARFIKKHSRKRGRRY